MACQGSSNHHYSFMNNLSVKADFHSVEFSDWTGNPLLMCENAAVNLNRMLGMTKILLSKIQCA